MTKKARAYLSHEIRNCHLNIRNIKTSKSLLDEPPHIYQGPKRDYQKFMILAQPRTGSSMLIGTLRKHPQIMGFGEIFNHKRTIFNIDGYENSSKPLLYLRNKYPINFLEHYIFSSYQNDTKAVGFKLLQDQINNRHLRCVWNWLEQNQDIKIIFLMRKDFLASYASLLLAQRTGKYGIKDQSQRDHTTLTIDYEECLQVFHHTKKQEENLLRLFRNHDLLKITYEELVENLDKSFALLQDFLKVDLHLLKVLSVKQEVRNLSDVINNYEELCKKFPLDA